MISAGIMLAAGISLLICLLAPIAGLIYMQKKRYHILRPYLIGMLTFTIWQLATRIPLITLILPKMDWYLMLSVHPYIHGLFLALTAGLFEEIGRYVSFIFMLKNNRRYVDGIAFGIGHGGIEAIILTGLGMVNALVVMAAINMGTYDLLTAGLDQSAADAIYQQYLSTGALDFLMSGLERLLAITIHVGLSVMVLQGINKGKGILYLILAILAHGAIDFVAVLLVTVTSLNSLVIEAVVALLAAMLAVYTVKAAKDFKERGFWHGLD